MESYRTTTKARKLGTAEATDADAIKKAAKEFKVPDPRKLIAVARGGLTPGEQHRVVGIVL